MSQVENKCMFAFYHGTNGGISEIEKYLKLKHNEEFFKSKLCYYIRKIIKFNEIQKSNEKLLHYNFMFLNDSTLFIDNQNFKQR